MEDRETLKLLALLAQYAEAYGRDCDESITVKQLADDLVESNFEPRQGVEAEELRDRIYDGLNQ